MEASILFNNTSSINPLITSNGKEIIVPIIIFLGLVISFINGLILAAFIADKKLQQRPANIIICSQACTDLFTGVVFCSDYIVEGFYTETNKLLGYIIGYMLYLSLFNLLALSADRYLAISFPILHHRIVDVYRTYKVISVIWITPLALTLIPLFWVSEGREMQKKALWVYRLSGVVFMSSLVIAMIILYIFIATKARKSIKQKRESLKEKSRKADLARKELRVAHLFGLLLFFFTIAYIPLLYINICFVAHVPPHRILIKLKESTIYLFMINSITNPVSCMFLKKDYLDSIKRIIRVKRRSFTKENSVIELQEWTSDSVYSPMQHSVHDSLIGSARRSKNSRISPQARRKRERRNNTIVSFIM